jgi:5'-nucleotidase
MNIDRGFGCPTWIVDRSPGDCVNIALTHLVDAQPDAVVNGINVGVNASLPLILASGTVAGAWEGALHGLPAIAFSQMLPRDAFNKLKAAGGTPDAELAETVRIASTHAANMLPSLVAASTPRNFSVHNVDFPYPCRAETPMCRTVPAQVILPQLLSPAADDGTHRFVFQSGEDISPGG